jgi:hypothetical protein
MAELEEFIEQVHNEPYNLLENNCIHKHARIVNKARALGHDASMMGCVSVLPRTPLIGLPIIWLHFYAKVDDKTVDVSFEPCLEQVSCRNEDIVKFLPINLSKLRPHDPEDGPPLPCFLPGWPWRK